MSNQLALDLGIPQEQETNNDTQEEGVEQKFVQISIYDLIDVKIAS